MRVTRRNESGAVAVEAALMLPLLTLLVMGIVEFGLLMRDAITTNSASRVAARTASAYSRDSNYIDRTLDRVAESTVMLGNTRVEVAIFKADPASGLPIGITSENDIWSCTNLCSRWQLVGSTRTSLGGNPWPANDTGPGATNSPDQQDACFIAGGVTPQYPDYVGVAIRTRHTIIGGPMFAFLDNDGGSGHRFLTTKTVFRLEPKSEGVAGACS